MNYFSIPGIIYYREPNEIIGFVEKTTGISKQDIISKKRNIEIIMARQMCVYLIRKKFYKYSLSEIGNFVGYNNDHASSIHCIKQIENRIFTEPQFKTRMENIFKILEIKDFTK